jgi:hypothetical protein
MVAQVIQNPISCWRVSVLEEVGRIKPRIPALAKMVVLERR